MALRKRLRKERSLHFSCLMCNHCSTNKSFQLHFSSITIGNPEGLGTEILEALVKMAPTKEEELKLKDYNGEISKLGSAERFLMAVLDIPFAFERIDAMLYRANFDTDVKYLSNSFEILEVSQTTTF